MLGKADTHGLGGHFVIADRLKGTAVGGIDQQHNHNNGDRGNQHGHEGGQRDGRIADGQTERAGTGKALEQVGAVGDGAQLAPLEHGADNFRKAQRSDGQIVGFQAQNGQADQEGQ